MPMINVEGLFGFVEDQDRDRWAQMNKAAEERAAQRGDIGRIAKEAAGPGMEMLEQGSRSQLSAAQNGVRNDARATRPTRTVVEQQAEFTDDEPTFG